MDEFVACTTAQEALLLTLIDRNDRIEALLHQHLCPPKTDDNALDLLTPADVREPISEAQEAKFTANRIRFGHMVSPDDAAVSQVEIGLTYKANRQRLEKNGFEVQKVHGEFYRIKWVRHL